MNLAAHQRSLLALLHDYVPPMSCGTEGEYLEHVAASDGLRVLRKIVSAWELYDVRRACPLTVAALEGEGSLDQTVALVRFEGTSAYLESRCALFLETVERTRTGTIASIARFERALNAVRAGDPREFAIDWNEDPTAIINGLLDDGRLVNAVPPGRYRTIVAANIPGYVRVVAAPP